MLLRIAGSEKHYEWGSRSLIPDYFSLPEPITPLAEIWFGTHNAGPATLTDGSYLSATISRELGFLAKFLSAAKPLSIQVHPTTKQAEEGFARENELGMEPNNPLRNYRDSSAKPELLVALTPFEALCGFRPLEETAEIFNELGTVKPIFLRQAESLAAGDLASVFTDLLSQRALAESFLSDFNNFQPVSNSTLKALELARYLLSFYPGDSGALVALMLNHLRLEPFEAIFLPAGNLHCYLSGLGVEVMKASDNVIRGGLTSKHIDVTELSKVVSFTPLANPTVRPIKLAEGLIEYQIPEQSFRVYKADLDGSRILADLDLLGEAIALGISGEVAISTSSEEREVLRQSEAVYLSGSKKFSLAGSGTIILVLGL
ncbi:MAG: mannose-6-phosphate isomerase, class I [Actinomycetota bacterium]